MILLVRLMLLNADIGARILHSGKWYMLLSLLDGEGGHFDRLRGISDIWPRRRREITARSVQSPLILRLDMPCHRSSLFGTIERAVSPPVREHLAAGSAEPANTTFGGSRPTSKRAANMLNLR